MAHRLPGKPAEEHAPYDLFDKNITAGAWGQCAGGSLTWLRCRRSRSWTAVLNDPTTQLIPRQKQTRAVASWRWTGAGKGLEGEHRRRAGKM